MKKLVVLSITTALVLMMSSMAMAQAGNTASGTLTVTAAVTSSMSLVFNTDPAGVTLTPGAGTNAATLPFGNISAFGALSSPNITRTVVAGTSFTVSTPVDVLVSKSNLTSANYTLTAQLGTNDATNTWSVGGAVINSTTATQITKTGTYGSNLSEAIAILVPFTEGATSINNSISFLATSN
jgi:hypothetical protein